MRQSEREESISRPTFCFVKKIYKKKKICQNEWTLAYQLDELKILKYILLFGHLKKTNSTSHRGSFTFKMSLSENAYHATKWQHYVADLSVHKPLWLFPLFVMIFFPLSSLSAYVSAVIHGQVPAFLPYISEAITLPPQAGYYTFYLSINA